MFLLLHLRANMTSHSATGRSILKHIYILDDINPNIQLPWPIDPRLYRHYRCLLSEYRMVSISSTLREERPKRRTPLRTWSAALFFNTFLQLTNGRISKTRITLTEKHHTTPPLFC